jgi:hypothetical protein
MNPESVLQIDGKGTAKPTSAFVFARQRRSLSRQSS